jgi:hypothetical protein
MLARLALITLALAATPALAQQHDGNDAALIGTWEGTFNSEAVGTGGMKLVISKDGAWKAIITISRDETMTAEAAGFTVKGNELSWTLGLHGASCMSTATREANVIKGETSCDRPVFTFELKKVT